MRPTRSIEQVPEQPELCQETLSVSRKKERHKRDRERERERNRDTDRETEGNRDRDRHREEEGRKLNWFILHNYLRNLPWSSFHFKCCVSQNIF